MFINKCLLLDDMRGRTKAIVAAGTLAAVVGVGFGVDSALTHKKIRTLVRRGISQELIDKYQAADVNVRHITKFIGRNATPEIVGELKEKEGLTSNDISQLVITGNFKVKSDSWGRRFDGKDYKRWNSSGFTLEGYERGTQHNILLEDALMWRKAGFTVEKSGPYGIEAILNLRMHRISQEDAAKLMAGSVPTYKMPEEYAKALGTTADNRLRYLQQGFTDPEIKILAAQRLTPDMFYYDILARQRGYNSSELPDKKKVVMLASLGKLTGENYRQFTDENFKPKDILNAVENGYDLERAKDWRTAGFDVDEMVISGQIGLSMMRALEMRRQGVTPFQAARYLTVQNVVEQYTELRPPSPKK